MYNLYFNQLKPHYKDKLSLIYGDTDSFLIKLDDYEDIYEEIAKTPLKDVMDLSNFEGHKLYNNDNKGVLGKVKSEVGPTPISEVVCLAPKSYSVLLDDGKIKSTCKGIKKNVQKNFHHDMYRDILNGVMKPNHVNVNDIRSSKNALQTVATTKRALTPRDIKRYHVSKEKSYGYGHPAIAKIHDETQVENIPKTAKKRACEDVTNDDQGLGCT